MIIKYYNGYINNNTLIDLTKTNKEGTTFYHLKSALEMIGFDVEGVKCSFKDLIKLQIPMPCICNCTINSSYKHFIVIYEIKNNYIIVGDPSKGVIKIPYNDFQKIYNGVILIAQPNRTIPYISDNNTYSFTKIILRNKKIIKLLILYSLLITFLSITTSFYFGKLIDNIGINANILLFIFVIFFSINMIKVVLEFFKNQIFVYLNKRMDLELTNDILENIFSLPYKYYKNRTIGDIISRIGDLSNLKDILNQIIICIFIDIPICIISIIVLFKINNKLALISLISCIISSIFIFLLKKVNIKINYRLKELNSISTSKMLESINGFETIKGLNISSVIHSKVIDKYLDYLNYYTRVSKFILNQNLFYEMISNITFLFVCYMGAKMVYINVFKLSSLITFNTVFNYFSSSLKSIMNMSINLNEFKISLKRINELIINKQDSGFLEYFTPGDILFSNLTFTFNDKINILNNINLRIIKNNKVLIIGKSGSGKSTLFKLLKGYYKPDLDSIFINNVDINNYNSEVLSKHIIYLNQNEILFNDTILNNILLDGLIDSKFMKVIKICEVDKIITQNNLGYNYIIEENGFNLSGGQRQRIALARTLLCDFDILIIDEALNQVDIILERKILSNIFKFYSNKTIIVISHRLDNYKLFDQVVELKEGKIIKNVFKKY